MEAIGLTIDDSDVWQKRYTLRVAIGDRVLTATLGATSSDRYGRDARAQQHYVLLPLARMITRQLEDELVEKMGKVL